MDHFHVRWNGGTVCCKVVQHCFVVFDWLACCFNDCRAEQVAGGSSKDSCIRLKSILSELYCYGFDVSVNYCSVACHCLHGACDGYCCLPLDGLNVVGEAYRAMLFIASLVSVGWGVPNVRCVADAGDNHCVVKSCGLCGPYA